MGDKEFALEFARELPGLTEYTKKALWHYKVRLEPSEVLAECYLYVHLNRNIITVDQPLVSIAKTWIRNNLSWSRSHLKLDMLATGAELGVHPVAGTPVDCSAFLVDWESSLAPREARLWEMWWHLGIRKGKAISGYLDISLSSGYLVLRECRVLETRLRNKIKQEYGK